MRSLIILLVAVILLPACKAEDEKAQEALMEEATLAGDQIATVAFQSLSGHLKSALAIGGIANAISYCNVNALPLTDSLSNNFEVSIKRTSDNLRNPANSSDSLEAYMFRLYKDIQKMRKPMVGKAILAKDQNVRYFAPIILQSQCLACHGSVGQEITDSTYSLIQERYPADAAIGYKEGQLRGIWSINFGDVEQTKAVIADLNSRIPALKN